MPQVPVRLPRVRVRAGLTTRELYDEVLAALSNWNDQQADAFAAEAIYALTREDMLKLAEKYVRLGELPSA